MEKKLRLVQVAREFKVGLGTITEFLEKKGIKDVAPNTLVESDVYALLEKEFGGNHLGGERANVRERMHIKQESVSLGDPIQLATYIAEEYNYDIEINSFGLGRFACLVESEYENRNNFVLDNSIVRRVDRQWFMRLHTLSTPSILETMTSELPTLYLLYNTEPNDQGFERWRYEYYTGYVHCPLNGIREVENMKLYNLPMQTVEANRIGFSEQRLGFGYEE